jgi:hypothetical protein
MGCRFGGVRGWDVRCFAALRHIGNSALQDAAGCVNLPNVYGGSWALMPVIEDVLRLRDVSALMGFYGLGASLHDAVALTARFGPGAIMGLGAGQAGSCDVLAPAAAWLGKADVAAAVALGRAGYYLAFGDAGFAGHLDVAPVAGAIEQLAAASGVGFMAVCLAAPGQGRTVYQGQLFEGGTLKGDLARAFSLALDGGVGVVPREIVAGGAAAIRAQCGRLKEQGKVLAVIDAICDADCAAAAAALAGMPLAGGAAGFAGMDAAWPDDAAAGPVAILSGARDRQTIFQIGAARDVVPVHDLALGGADPVAAACGWAADKLGAGSFIISSSVPPDRLTPDAPAAMMLGEIARGLAALGVRRFIVAGGETGAAVAAALGLHRLRAAAATGALLWLRDEDVSISFKASGGGAKNLFLSEFGPQLRLNNIAELAT